MSEQIKQFKTVRGNLTLVKGRGATKNILATSVFAISVGSNDIFGYFENRSTVDPTIFIASLLTAYECHIEVHILHTCHHHKVQINMYGENCFIQPVSQKVPYWGFKMELCVTKCHVLCNIVIC